MGAETIVSAVIGLGHAIHLEVPAESVKNADQLGRLREMGCDLAQGYHIASPSRGGDIPALWAGAGYPVLRA